MVSTVLPVSPVRISHPHPTLPESVEHIHVVSYGLVGTSGSVRVLDIDTNTVHALNMTGLQGPCPGGGAPSALTDRVWSS